MSELTEYKHAHDYWEAEAKRLRAELAFMRGHGIVQDNERLRAELGTLRLYADEVARNSNRDLAAKDARIAELEEDEKERFKLVQDADIWMKACWKAQGDTKRAEAERDALRRQMSDVGDRLECAIKDVGKRQYHIEVAITRVRAALNPPPAGREG